MLNVKEETVLNTVKKYAKVAGFSFVALVVGWNSHFYNDSGVNTRIQQPLLGWHWVKVEGHNFKIPFLSRTASYNQRGTVAQSDSPSIVKSASLVISPRPVQFADSYEMNLEWSMRYELPVSDQDLEAMHQALKSESNLLGNTVMPFAQTLVNDSANQMLGSNFAQGGRNALRTLIDNQSMYGMYQTRVESVSQNETTGKGSNDRSGKSVDDLEITKVVYLEDPTTGKKLRTPLSISQYGIKIVPNSISIIKSEPLGELVKFIKTKQENIALQIEEDEKQKLLTKQTQSETLRGEKNLVTRTNELNIKKQEAIIKAEQRVAEAELQAAKETIERQKVADLAIIDKQRELQVAKANEGIQKANDKAATYQAAAIKKVGFAKAAVKKADYQAIDKQILSLEVDKAKALAMYKSNMTVNMPTVVSGNSGVSSSLETMSTLKIMEQLGKSATK